MTTAKASYASIGQNTSEHSSETAAQAAYSCHAALLSAVSTFYLVCHIRSLLLVRLHIYEYKYRGELCYQMKVYSVPN
jgi:hypothetical protein